MGGIDGQNRMEAKEIRFAAYWMSGFLEGPAAPPIDRGTGIRCPTLLRKRLGCESLPIRPCGSPPGINTRHAA